MLNMIDTQDKLKNFSEEQLIREMQMPSGSAPQFMVLSEIERRKRMRSDAQRQEGLMQPTVAQEAVSAAGVPQQGIAQVAQSLAPKTDMTQNTGVSNMQASKLPGQPNQPQRMADGGIMRLAPGGFVSGDDMSAIARLKVSNPALYEQYKDKPEELARIAASLSSSMLTQLGESESQGSGGYNAENSEGFVGKYQFGNDRLKDFRRATGQDFTMEQFKASPALQEEAVQWHRGDILDYAKTKGLDKLYGTEVGGVLVNDDSIMAMAHIGGKPGMREFLESGGSEEENQADSNGTSIRDYGMKFSGQLQPDYSPGVIETTKLDGVPQGINAQPPGLLPLQPDYSSDAVKTGPLTFPNFVPKAYPGQQVQGGMGLGQILDPNATSVYGGYEGFVERTGEGIGSFLDSASKIMSPIDKQVARMEKIAKDKRDKRGYEGALRAREEKYFGGREGYEYPNEVARLMGGREYEKKRLAVEEKRQRDIELAKEANSIEEKKMQQNQGIRTLLKEEKDSKAEDKSFKATASKLGQSEWLALAQTGLTLMSDPNLANAGKAGLSAYKDLKAIDLAKAKANTRKPIAGAYVTNLQKRVDNLLEERGMLKDPEKLPFYKGGGMSDPDRVDRERINRQIAELERAIDQAYRSAGININTTGSKNTA